MNKLVPGDKNVIRMILDSPLKTPFIPTLTSKRVTVETIVGSGKLLTRLLTSAPGTRHNSDMFH